MNNESYLVIGASGYLGSYFIKNIIASSDKKIIATYHDAKPEIFDDRINWLKLDVTNQDDVSALFAEIKKYENKFNVIYLSAFHHPDKVEENPAFAHKINVEALENILQNMPNISSFYYSSTDTVYGESLNNYHFTEIDLHNPINEYGRQKSLAEKITLSHGHNVIHYPFLIGPSLTSKKHFFDFIAGDLKSGKKIEAFYDSYRSSIDFNSATIYTLQLIEMHKNIGTINISADEDLSKYDVFLKIAEKFNCDKNLILPISITQTNGIFLAKRPASTLLDNTKIKSLLNLSEIKIAL